MRLSDLQAKDVVSLKDGKRLGKIIDVEIDSNEGKIIYLIVEQKKSLRTYIGSSGDVAISFSQIAKIGEDVILVDI